MQFPVMTRKYSATFGYAMKREKKNIPLDTWRSTPHEESTGCTLPAPFSKGCTEKHF
jgi:hypothetical protein